MPATIDSIITSANKEWTHWGNSTWNLVTRQKNIAHRDDDETFARYIIDQYCSVAGGNPSLTDIQDDRYAWSAVGMSTIMKNAGYLKSEFPFAQSHSTYIRRFIADRRKGNANAAFWGYRHGEAGGQPAVCDLVGYARGKGVLDSVTRKTLKIGADGHIADSEHGWFVTLKRRQS